MKLIQLKIGGTIKIGRDEITLNKGDHLYDNGASIQLMTGDKRTLKWQKNGRFRERVTNLTLPKKLIKKLDFKSLHKIEVPFFEFTHYKYIIPYHD